MIKEHGHSQHNKEICRHASKNILDAILTNNPGSVSQVCGTYGMSYHNALMYSAMHLLCICIQLLCMCSLKLPSYLCLIITVLSVTFLQINLLTMLNSNSQEI